MGVRSLLEVCYAHLHINDQKIFTETGHAPKYEEIIDNISSPPSISSLPFQNPVSDTLLVKRSACSLACLTRK